METRQVADLLARKFISRRDVKAVQKVLRDGTVVYTPDGKRQADGTYSEYYPWDRESLTAHVTGERSLGHYLLDTDSKTKLFSFDIDLEKAGFLPRDEDWTEFEACNPREVWRDRAAIHQRAFIKLQFKSIAHMLLKTIVEELSIPCAAAYSGGKGVHVYGFTGHCAAYEAREGAMIVLDALDRFEPLRGQNFFRDKETDHTVGFQNLSIELFPKQDSLEGKDLGNLMRLPLGVNMKNPKDPTFFIDMNSPHAMMRPIDPVVALTASSPWDS